MTIILFLCAAFAWCIVTASMLHHKANRRGSRLRKFLSVNKTLK